MCCAILLWKKLCFRNTWSKLEAGEGQKKCMRGWGWGSLACTVSWLYSLSVIIVTTQHQHPPFPHHLHHHHTGLLVSTTFPRPFFPGYSRIHRFPYPFIYFNKGNSFYTPEAQTPPGIERFHMTSRRPYLCSKNKRVAMLVFQTNPVGVDLFSYVNTFFCCHKFT